MRLSHLVAAAALAVTAACVVAPTAHAEPSTARKAAPATVTVEPSIPMPVPEGSFGYIATRGATEWMNSRAPGAFIRSLPVSPEYRVANSSMAKIIDAELDAAMDMPGACVQVIVTPQAGSGLFSYGFFAVEPEYCPS